MNLLLSLPPVGEGVFVMGWRAYLVSAAAGCVALATTGSGIAQQVTVLDAKCRLDIVSACYQRNTGSEVAGSRQILVSGSSYSQQTYLGNWLEKCSAWFEVEQYGACLRTQDHPTQSSAAAIQQGLSQVQQEISQLNKTLRSDQRAMLNQICKSLSQRPETCDASMPAQ